MKARAGGCSCWLYGYSMATSHKVALLLVVVDIAAMPQADLNAPLCCAVVVLMHCKLQGLLKCYKLLARDLQYS